MRQVAVLFCLCVTFSVCAKPTSLNYSSITYSETNENDYDADDSSEEVSQESEDNLGDLTPDLRSDKQCQTPNNEFARCIPISKCDILLKQVSNKEASEFLLASQCEPSGKGIYNPKVCCGKYNNYANISTTNVKNILPKSCGRQKMFFEKRITGGKEAFLGEYPWMVRLIYRNKHGIQSGGCSGFLVHSKFVITAAHCTHPLHTERKGEVYLVILGDHNTATEKDCSPTGTVCAESHQERGVIKVITHPDYDPLNNSHYNDIAIIRIKKSHLSEFVQSICLPKNENQIPARYYLSGWGTTENGLTSDIKMKVEVPPFDKEECKKKFSSKKVDLGDSQICAGGEKQKDSCRGDSGGPLMMVNDNETWFAVGVVSFGMGCGMEGWPAVYTETVKYFPWIKSQMVLNMRSVRRQRLHSSKPTQ